MAGNIHSRRRVVLAGLAVGGVLAPLAFAKRFAASKDREGSGQATPGVFAAAARAERELWEALVGQSFRIVGEAGMIGASLSAVERIAFDPDRPEGLGRDQSFYAYFDVGQSVAPAGQQSYTMLHPEFGEFSLFLARGEDRGNEAVVYALFN